MATWIDFNKLREEIRFEDVLRHYHVEIDANKGGQHQGFCPIPTHKGKGRSPSFSANLEKGIFNCFGCGARGNLIDFAVLMERLNPDNGADVRKAALILQDKFKPSRKSNQSFTAKRPMELRERPEIEQYELPGTVTGKAEPTIVVNQPLDFELKRLDPEHPYLDRRGFDQETIRHFGLGFCSKGLLADRIAIPLHNPAGQLVGYAGRAANDSAITKDNPRYLFPPKREREGVLYEFHKMELLYNAHRLKAPVAELAIVEGFTSVWWLFQMGFPNVVALMGSSMSEAQARIITKLVPQSGRIVIIPDGDEAGERCAHEAFEELGTHRFLHWLKLDEGKQPTDYPGGWFGERLKR